MLQQVGTVPEGRSLICVDSYHQGVLKGRFYGPLLEGERFESLSQFLVKTEQLLNDLGQPQSYTSTRSFAESFPDCPTTTGLHLLRGKSATFEMRILYRQHTSWQGILFWREQDVEKPFRSVLELVLLMDSALRSAI